MFTCPCCGYEVFASPPGSYDICPICFWEDDVSGLWFAADGCGANHEVSLIAAQVNFVQFGACVREMAKNVRPPDAGDRRDPLWFPLWAKRVTVPGGGESAPRSVPASQSELCYWLREPS